MKERTEQILWIPDYIDDVAADFLVFYRIAGIPDRFDGLSSAQFLKLAVRLVFYPGVIQQKAMRLSQKAEQEKQDKYKRMGIDPKDIGSIKEVPFEQLKQENPGLIGHGHGRR